MSDVIRLDATVELQAAAGDGSKPAKVSIMAYGGGAIHAGGWGEVVIDLAGLQMPPTIPLLADHVSTLESVAGSGTPRVVQGQLIVEGTLASNETGQRVVALHRDGIPLQASVGVDVGPGRQSVKAGDSIQVNGRSIKAGPNGLVVIKGKLFEVSILPLGADSSTSVHVAAKKGRIMPPEDQDETQVVDEVQAERERVSSIFTAARKYAQLNAPNAAAIMAIADAAVNDGTDERDAEIAMMRVRANVSTAARLGGGGSRRSREATGLEAIEACLLIRAGFEPVAVKHYGEQIAEQARHMRASSFVDLCAHALRLEGRETGGMSRDELVRASFSTISLPTALSNVTGKTLLPAYEQNTATWRGFANVDSAADFKPQTGIRPSMVGGLREHAPTGEVKHVQMKESVYEWALKTYTGNFTVSRTDVINDDLGFLRKAPELFGKAAALAVNNLVYSTILGNANSFFNDTTHDNLLDGALDAAGLEAAVTAMRIQKTDEGDDIQISPRVLVVPPELEFTAKALVNSTLVGVTDGSPTGNPLQGIVAVVSESRLSNTAKFAGASATGWYLFGAPSDNPITVGYLDGRQAPIVETFGFDHDVNVLAMTFRCIHDFGVALGDWRAAVKSDPGA